MAQTVLVRTANGGQTLMDVPQEGTHARELFDAKIADGRWSIIGERSAPAAVEPEPVEPVEGAPAGTIDEVIAWVRQDDDEGEPTDGWPTRAAEALAAEQGRPDGGRKSLVKLLEGLVS